MEGCHVAQNGLEWCGMTHVRAVWYKAVWDGIVWDGAESRDVRVVLGAVAAWFRIVHDGAW